MPLGLTQSGYYSGADKSFDERLRDNKVRQMAAAQNKSAKDFLEDRDHFKEIAATYPNKLYVSIDDLKGHSMIGGWIEKSGHTSEKVLNVYNNSKVRGFVFTDITRDGMMKGIDKNKIINEIS